MDGDGGQREQRTKKQKNNSGVVVRNQYLYRLFLLLAVVALPGGFQIVQHLGKN
jgi:hypothetical protein